MLFRYVFVHYLKNMLTILMALSTLFAGLDFLINASSLPSFNIKILYVFSKWQEALGLLYPLAIIFGAIWTKIAFIKKNTIGALYALGVSRLELFKPFFTLALLVYLLFTGLNFTSFATANETAYMLKENTYGSQKTEDMFFKYNSNFVYVRLLIPYERRLEHLTLFKLKEGKVYEVQQAKEAYFDGEQWLAKDVIRKIKVEREGKSYLTIEHLDQLYTLKGYRPEILNSIYEDKHLTLYESFMAYRLLDSQGVGTFKIRADLYAKAVMPLFSIALLVILFFRFPFHARYMNVGMTTIKALGGTLFVWGILFALQQMGANDVLPPELATPLPVVLLWLYAIRTLGVSKDRI
jgi:lipopolysaccharide export system permease protein